MFLLVRRNLDCESFKELKDALSALEDVYDPNQPTMVLSVAENTCCDNPTTYKIIDLDGFRFVLENNEIFSCLSKGGLAHLRKQVELVSADKYPSHHPVAVRAVLLDSKWKDTSKPFEMPAEYAKNLCAVVSKGVTWAQAVVLEGKAYVLTDNLHELVDVIPAGLFLTYQGKDWPITGFTVAKYHRVLAGVKTTAPLAQGLSKSGERYKLKYRLNGKEESGEISLDGCDFLPYSRYFNHDVNFQDLDLTPVRGEWLVVSDGEIRGYFTNWLACCRYYRHGSVRNMIQAPLSLFDEENPADPYFGYVDYDHDCDFWVWDWLKRGSNKIAPGESAAEEGYWDWYNRQHERPEELQSAQ